MHQYKTDSQLSMVMDRVTQAVYKKLKSAKFKFKVKPGNHDTCGNVRVYFDAHGNAVLSDNWRGDGMVSSREQISSALALYRTISLFECGIETNYCDYYKMNWCVHLEHKKTGQILGLGEWKGGFQIFTQGHSLEQLPADFIKDCEALLTLLVSKSMPIGYDGTVAGSVA